MSVFDEDTLLGSPVDDDTTRVTDGGMQTTEEGIVAESGRNVSDELEISKQIQKFIPLTVVECHRVLGASLRTTDPIRNSVMEAVEQ